MEGGIFIGIVSTITTILLLMTRTHSFRGGGGVRCVCACMVITFSKLGFNWDGCKCCSWSADVFFFLAPPAPENLASRDGFGVPSHASALIDSTPRLNLVLTHELPPLSPAFRH